MQDKLSREDFVLERFPDDVFHEMEKKEMKEVGIEQGIQRGIKQGKKEGKQEGIKEGIEQEKRSIIKNLLNKNMSKEEIANLLNYDIKKICEIEKTLNLEK